MCYFIGGEAKDERAKGVDVRAKGKDERSKGGRAEEGVEETLSVPHSKVRAINLPEMGRVRS